MVDLKDLVCSRLFFGGGSELCDKFMKSFAWTEICDRESKVPNLAWHALWMTPYRPMWCLDGLYKLAYNSRESRARWITDVWNSSCLHFSSAFCRLSNGLHIIKDSETKLLSRRVYIVRFFRANSHNIAKFVRLNENVSFAQNGASNYHDCEFLWL